MADIIHILPGFIANQIAAGEVVQRPASVVKELLENSIDAGAKNIQIILKEGGKSLIHIIDDGKGMSPKDARLSFLRHSTSKISSSEDLFKIYTKGFRGEALASIASVCELEIQTSESDAELGIQLAIESGKIKKQNPIKIPKGTQIIVKNLFYNVPVRRNFLKPTQLELRYIIDEFHRIALAHFEINFELYHSGELIFQLKSKPLRQRIMSIFGNKINEQLIPLAESTHWSQIEGFVARPIHSKKYRKEQFFFVNNRFIKNAYLYRAVLDAFEGLLKPSYHPSFFIFINLDPKHIDINIHPTKTEIKFDDESSLFNFLRATIKHALGQYQVTAALDFEAKQNWEIPISTGNKNFVYAAPKIRVDPTYNPFSLDSTPKNYASFSSSDLYEHLKKDPNLVIEKDFNEKKEFPSLFETEERPGDLSRCLQIYDKYILASKKNEFIVIDQHRAHLRILYEKFLDSKKKDNQASQALLFPIKIELNFHEMMWIKELTLEMENIGFKFKIEEKNLSFDFIPFYMEAKKIENFIENLLSNPNLIKEENIADQKIAYCMAKASAIRSETKLSAKEMEQMIKALFSCKEFNYTPKGNPIFAKLGKDFIEKQFYK